MKSKIILKIIILTSVLLSKFYRCWS